MSGDLDFNLKENHIGQLIQITNEVENKENREYLRERARILGDLSPR